MRPIPPLLALTLLLCACATKGPAPVRSAYVGSRCPPGSGCAPAPSPLRQYFDVSQKRYYYYDPATYRYYWENGSPRS